MAQHHHARPVGGHIPFADQSKTWGCDLLLNSCTATCSHSANVWETMTQDLAKLSGHPVFQNTTSLLPFTAPVPQQALAAKRNAGSPPLLSHSSLPVWPPGCVHINNTASPGSLLGPLPGSLPSPPLFSRVQPGSLSKCLSSSAKQNL